MPIRVVFVVDKTIMGQAFLRILRFPIPASLRRRFVLKATLYNRNS